jgi:hypothetical protein
MNNLNATRRWLTTRRPRQGSILPAAMTKQDVEAIDLQPLGGCA